MCVYMNAMLGYDILIGFLPLTGILRILVPNHFPSAPVNSPTPYSCHARVLGVAQREIFATMLDQRPPRMEMSDFYFEIHFVLKKESVIPCN